MCGTQHSMVMKEYSCELIITQGCPTPSPRLRGTVHSQKACARGCCPNSLVSSTERKEPPNMSTPWLLLFLEALLPSASCSQPDPASERYHLIWLMLLSNQPLACPTKHVSRHPALSCNRHRRGGVVQFVHLLLQLGDGLPRVEVLGTYVGTVHDALAAVQLVLVV